MSAWNLLSGTIIGNSYYLKKVLGAGAFGGVFLADHIVNNQRIAEVAVKMIIADGTQNQLNELLAGTNLDHPNLLRYLGGGQCHFQGTDFLYLVMEKADSTLQDELKRRRLSEEEIKQLVSDIASGLNYLHTLPSPVIHRDLKPANILKKGNTWKIADLGLVTQLTKGTHFTESPKGTIIYMPPESWNNKVSPAWDLWSLGVIILEALTNQYPYDIKNKNTAQFITQVLQEKPYIPKLNAPWHKIVQGCLSKERSHRWTAQQVLDKLSQQFSFPSIPLPSWQNIQTIGICGSVAAIAIAGMSMMSFVPTRTTAKTPIADEPSIGNTQINNDPQCNAKTNKIFHQRHPELKGRKIKKGEDHLAKEWLQIRNSLTNCRTNVSPKSPTKTKSPTKPKLSKKCVKDTNRIFYQRHPELNGRKIREGEDYLRKEWLDITKSLTSCGKKTNLTQKNSYITRPSNNSLKYLSPKSTCGDIKTNSPTNWYPVYIENKGSNLTVVRSEFCRDAILKYRKHLDKNYIQVASFNSYQKASRFAKILDDRFSGVEIGEPSWR